MPRGISVTISKSTKDIGEQLANELVLEINKKLAFHKNKLKNNILLEVYNRVINDDVIKSIVSGKLRAEFGLSNDIISTIAQDIAFAVTQETAVYLRSFIARKTVVVGGLRVEFFNKDYAQILNIPGASYNSNGHDINWLRWLLLNGVETIVMDFHILYKYAKKSRSGQAIMVPKGFWYIPGEYAGDASDNFLTRSILDKGFLDRLRVNIQESLRVAIS